jgi:predicted TPR repeat methyltransferase
MDRYEETFQTWNKVAQLYEDIFMDLDIYNDTYDYFLGLLKTKYLSILEIGCGPGNITKYLLSRRPDLKIKGIDISQNMIELAQKNNPTAQFEVMDGRAIQQLQASFDAIVCGFIIPYLSQNDCSTFLSNSSQKLNSDGFIYLSFVDGDYQNSDFITGSSGDRAYFYYYNADFIKKELKANQLEVLKIIDKPYLKSDNTKEIHKVIIAQKEGDSLTIQQAE